MSELIKNVLKESVFTLADLVQVEEGRVNSLTLSQTPRDQGHALRHRCG